MSLVERLGLAFLQQLDPETAHDMAIHALKLGLAPKRATPTSPRLETTLAGLKLPNPVGLAAGLDKNAVGLNALLAAGFGFIEIGAVTPKPQPGNPKPRLFRLPDHQAVINRFGFNSDGMDAVAERLERPRRPGVVGINLGANKTSDDKAADFAAVLQRTGAYVDFATVNVSSPNTEKLRDLQGPDALRAVIGAVLEANQTLAKPIPIFLKIAPDLDQAQIDQIADVVLEMGVDAVTATNTTVSREGIRGPFKDEPGGLSGGPLLARSTGVLVALAERFEGRVPLVGVGGISSAEEARAKLASGATAVQLYSALVYKGLSLAAHIARDLDRGLHD